MIKWRKQKVSLDQLKWVKICMHTFVYTTYIRYIDLICSIYVTHMLLIEWKDVNFGVG